MKARGSGFVWCFAQQSTRDNNCLHSTSVIIIGLSQWLPCLLDSLCCWRAQRLVSHRCRSREYEPPYCPYGTIVHSWYYSPLWTGTDSESLNREIVFVHHEQCILQCVYAVNFRKHSNDLVDALYRGREKMRYFSSGLWREILTPWCYCLFLHLYTLIIIDSW